MYSPCKLPYVIFVFQDLTCKGSWAFSLFTLFPQHRSHCQLPLQIKILCEKKPSFSERGVEKNKASLNIET